MGMHYDEVQRNSNNPTETKGKMIMQQDINNSATETSIEVKPSKNLAIALGYGANGLPVIPSNSKKRELLAPYCVEDASTDPDKIKKMWSDNPEACIASPTGIEDGIGIAIEVDMSNINDNNFDELTDSLRRSYFIFYSGKGWKHFFKLPKGKKWESSENVIFKGVITRGSEDFTILPNDKHGYTKLIEYLGSNSFPEPDEMLSRILDHPETDYNTLSLGITTANIATLLRNPAPEIKFLFKDMIPAGTLGGLVGQGGIGKSYIVMELIVSAAIGRKLIAAFDPVEPCEVLYVQAEDQLDELHRRLRKIFDYYNLTEAEIALCEKNIQLCLFQAKSLVMSIKGKELATTESFEWLENRIKQQDTKFCVLDPLSSFSWIEENSNSEVAQYMAKLRTLTKLTDEGTTILCVHHTSKANQESMDSSSGRGASAFRDAFRFNLTMTSASSKAQEYGIQGDIHNYALIGVTKANMSARNNTDILLKRASGKNGGVICEISISELKGTLKKARLDRMAKLLPELIASNPNDFSINQWKTGSTEEIKDFKSILKDEHKATQKNIPEAFDRAIELELIRIDEIPVDGSKRPKQVPRAIESDPTK